MGEKVASPYASVLAARGTGCDSDPGALFSYAVEHLNRFNLAYLHLIEPRVGGSEVIHPGQGAIAAEQLRPIFNGKMLAAGGFEPETAETAVKNGTVDAVAFDRYFVSNPDLPRRIKDSLPLASYDGNTFYTFDAKGYSDYPTYASADGVAGASQHQHLLPVTQKGVSLGASRWA